MTVVIAADIAERQVIMQVRSTRLGLREVTEEQRLLIPEGLAGFETVHEYCLIPHAPNSPFLWLQALQRPELTFVLINPFDRFPSYTITVQDEDAEALGIRHDDQLLAFAIITCASSGMTANLAGPLVMNTSSRQARQLILADSSYACRQPL